MKPLISVCVPTFNGEQYLGECLDSLLAQTETDFELIVVDDQSTDETFDILKSYASRDPRIRIYRNDTNLGLVGNWNRCVELAQAEWIKFVFQDDFIAPRCLEKLLANARADRPLVVCHRDIVFESVPAETREYYERVLATRSLSVLLGGSTYLTPAQFCDIAVQHLGLNFVGEPTATLLHRSSFERFGKFNSGLVQLCDFEYWARVGMHAGLTFVPETLATFRVHMNSASATNESAHTFRSEVLDSLILMYEFAYQPEFAPIRRSARRMGVNLKRAVAEKAYWARGFAKRTSESSLGADRSVLEQWQSVVADHPKLGDSLYLKVEKLKHELDRRFRWRFKDGDEKTVV